MQKALHSKLLLLLLILSSSCGQPLPTLENIDLKVWASDKNACSEKRTLMVESLNKQKEKLLALSENQIVSLLGRPDHNELYKRNQKFYYYFLEPSENCKKQKTNSPQKLVIRFNAMGIAKEVSIES